MPRAPMMTASTARSAAAMNGAAAPIAAISSPTANIAAAPRLCRDFTQVVYRRGREFDRDGTACQQPRRRVGVSCEQSPDRRHFPRKPAGKCAGFSSMRFRRKDLGNHWPLSSGAANLSRGVMAEILDNQRRRPRLRPLQPRTDAGLPCRKPAGGPFPGRARRRRTIPSRQRRSRTGAAVPAGRRTPPSPPSPPPNPPSPHRFGAERAGNRQRAARAFRDHRRHEVALDHRPGRRDFQSGPGAPLHAAGLGAVQRSHASTPSAMRWCRSWARSTRCSSSMPRMTRRPGSISVPRPTPASAGCGAARSSIRHGKARRQAGLRVSSAIARGIGDIGRRRTSRSPCYLFRRQIAHRLGRRAQDQLAVLEHLVFGHQRAGAHQAVARRCGRG